MIFIFGGRWDVKAFWATLVAVDDAFEGMDMYFDIRDRNRRLRFLAFRK